MYRACENSDKGAVPNSWDLGVAIPALNILFPYQSSLFSSLDVPSQLDDEAGRVYLQCRELWARVEA